MTVKILKYEVKLLSVVNYEVQWQTEDTNHLRVVVDNL